MEVRKPRENIYGVLANSSKLMVTNGISSGDREIVMYPDDFRCAHREVTISLTHSASPQNMYLMRKARLISHCDNTT